MKPFIHHCVASSLLLLVGACSTYKPLDQGSDVPWAMDTAQPYALAPYASDDRSRIGDQTVSAREAPAADLSGRVYRVQRGDTLLSIARRHRVKVAEIAAANGLAAPFVIYAGDVLEIPARVEVAPLSARAEQHVVRPGENLHVIARQHGVTVTTLSEHNELSSPDDIQAGQRLDVPQDETPGAVEEAAVQPAQPLGEGFLWPVQGKVITRFGAGPDGSISHGIAIAARKGTPIRSAAAGQVIYAGDAISGYGRMVLIRHDDDYVTTYAHAQTLLVQVGENVLRGQVIGRVGDTGNVDEAQLHFELRKGRKPLDPEAHLVLPVTEVASSQ